MDASILSVHWHENSEPIYSVHFQPNREGNHSERLVTGGGDNNVRVSIGVDVVLLYITDIDISSGK